MEFAFVAPVFFALMLGILEIGVMTFAQFALQNSVTDAGRHDPHRPGAVGQYHQRPHMHGETIRTITAPV